MLFFEKEKYLSIDRDLWKRRKEDGFKKFRKGIRK